jgi:cell division protein FtsW
MSSLNKKISQVLQFFYRWWRSIDRITFVALLLLILLGMVLLMASSPAIAERLGKDGFFFLKRQVIYLVLGLVVMIFLSSLSKEMNIFLCLVGYVLVILALIFVALFGMELNGAKSWISLGAIALQPSEFIKPILAVVVAWILANQNRNYWKNLLYSFIAFAIPLSLIITQPDFGMSVLLAGIWSIQIFLSQVPFYWIILAGFGILLMGVVGYLTIAHVASRIDKFIDPSSGINEQNTKSLDAFISGGFFGKGPGEGVIKSFLPDSHTDFIFAVAGEELGIIVCLLIVAIFCFIIFRVFKRLLLLDSQFLIIAIVGLISQFALQAIINMSVSLNILPNTGMTLPFVSYGGSSLLSLAIAFGLIFSFNKIKYIAR